MAKIIEKTRKEVLLQYAPLAGVILVVSGLLLLLDQRLRTNWLSLSIPAFIGLVIFGYGIYKRNHWWAVPGLIIIGLGSALITLLIPSLKIEMTTRLGYSFLANSLAWLFIFFIIWLKTRQKAWWALFVSFILASLTIIFLSQQFTLLIFVFYLSVAIGVVFLLWGGFSGRMALIVPGALLIATGAGVYFGWSNPETPGGLQKTGIMLVWFALGWVLITVFSRIMNKRFVWWPLIPGGILLMVGSGLYIGGNPENALGFLGNTGSIGLILVGAYLIFLKFGMKR